MNEPTDLFGRPTGPDQLSLFGPDEAGAGPSPSNLVPAPEVIRRRLMAVLAQARASEVMPWPEPRARMWQTVFPQMADWLPREEAEQLRFEFAREIERLRAAA